LHTNATENQQRRGGGAIHGPHPTYIRISTRTVKKYVLSNVHLAAIHQSVAAN
jgi:hypothetical protein